MKEKSNSQKTRLDSLMVRRNLAPSGNRARALIMSGRVSVDGKRVEKPGTSVREDSIVEVEEPARKFVSRAGVKLEKAITQFSIDVKGKVALDIGASTGGFTDCLLRFGAQRVYAFDVGHGQIDWNLRNDSRVIVREKINCRYLKPEDVGEKVDLVTIDVSFISLSLIIEPAACVLKEDGTLIALIKPQFEVGRKDVGTGGVVKNERSIKEAADKVTSHLGRLGFNVTGVTESPIKGTGGNREFLVCATLGAPTSLPSPQGTS
ncbi:MAG: TlyA family RNA methyltransferase [Candidatus Dadabacteria bacterium]|nr:TlyA family RNA methyltransferase [Candidatus Dadabacteria bacterium]MDE0663567.1 TlyA family RNA methyltransferase [Candidatus Dadabacteria bacterium]